MSKYSIETVREIFEAGGCKLLSDEYVQVKAKLAYRCSCGNTSLISLDHFKRGQRCAECRRRKIAESQRHSLEHVKKFFESNDCVLLSEDYFNNHQKLRYICSCGNESEISFSKFASGQRCIKCKHRKISEKLSGRNNPKWNADKTEEERIRERKYPEYTKWRRSVFERDDFTCQCCGLRGGVLNAHHIEAYSKNPDIRTDISNGITLCAGCHKEYHDNFHRNDATRDDFYEFLAGEYREPWYAGEVDILDKIEN